MLNSKKVSTQEIARVFDYLIFKVKHGGNIVSALQTYMEGNRSKASRPIQGILDRIAMSGDAFEDVALEVGLIDRRGYLILTSGVETAKALPVIRESTKQAQFGVSAVILLEFFKKWIGALFFGLLVAVEPVRSPVVNIFEKMNQASKAAGSTAQQIPSYLTNPWLITQWVMGIGIVVALLLGGLWWLNRNRTDIVYRFLPFRFYEDWVSLLDLYLAFKSSGQSDYKAALSLASSCPDDSFNQRLFTEIADSMRKSGASFYDALAEYEASFPADVLSFFLDASKTGQIDVYILQAKVYCTERLDKLVAAAKIWTPALTGVIMLMTFGMLIADLFVGITMASMKPITG